MRFAMYSLAVLAGLAAVGFAQGPRDADVEGRRRDQIHSAVQRLCPVSGQELGAHGAPVKAKIGEETVFLCCKACVKRKVNPQHWAAIHANFAKAQGICPVMKHGLPAKPKWTIVEGRIVYVCCPPCADKVAENPQAVLRQIDRLYVASLESRQRSE